MKAIKENYTLLLATLKRLFISDKNAIQHIRLLNRFSRKQRSNMTLWEKIKEGFLNNPF